MVFVKFILDGVLHDIPSNANAPKALLEMKNQQNLKNYSAFLRCLTLCHTVVRGKNGKYRAESPDELALIEGVAGYECQLLERGSTSMKAQLLGEACDYDILAVNAFNADRKRMSLVM